MLIEYQFIRVILGLTDIEPVAYFHPPLELTVKICHGARDVNTLITLISWISGLTLPSGKHHLI